MSAPALPVSESRDERKRLAGVWLTPEASRPLSGPETCVRGAIILSASSPRSWHACDWPTRKAKGFNGGFRDSQIFSQNSRREWQSFPVLR